MKIDMRYKPKGIIEFYHYLIRKDKNKEEFNPEMRKQLQKEYMRYVDNVKKVAKKHGRQVVESNMVVRIITR